MKDRTTNHKNYVIATGEPFKAKIQRDDKSCSLLPVIAIDFRTDGELRGIVINQGRMIYADEVEHFAGYVYEGKSPESCKRWMPG